MTKPQNIAGIEKATNQSWEEWLVWLDDRKAIIMPHKDIASLVYKELDGKIESAGWWSQGVTVAYEQHIGRRVPGQRSDGTFEVSVSKTLAEDRDSVFAKCTEALEGATDFAGKKVSKDRTSVTPVRSYWRCDLDNGSKVTWSVETKSDGKTLLVVTHAAVASEDEASQWRVFWRDYLEKIV